MTGLREKWAGLVWEAPYTGLCAICKEDGAQIGEGDYGNIRLYDCSRCGKFVCPAGLPQVTGEEEAAAVSSWVYRRNRAGEEPAIIDRDTVASILHQSFPSIDDRIGFFMEKALATQRHLGDSFRIDDRSWIAATYSKNRSEVLFLADAMLKDGLLESKFPYYRISMKGHMQSDRLIRRNPMSEKAFVAMWFDKTIEAIYEKGFDVGIRNAGYEPVRVDRTEHNNKIDDEIIELIRASSFVVADFTGHRGGVYFEAGFALGINLPVIWTCKEDHMKDLHFYIRQYNTIVWTDRNHEEFVKRLQHRIEATLGKGPRVSTDDRSSV